jgi:hypothetical protein
MRSIQTILVRTCFQPQNNLTRRAVDGYSNGGGGYSLTESDAVTFLSKLSTEAAGYGMSTGIKNAQEILRNASHLVQFAVNEQCAADGECGVYNDFLAKGKPVFHIEYAKYSVDANAQVTLTSDQMPGATTEQIRAAFCLENADRKAWNGTKHLDKRDDTENKFSTVAKVLLLDGFVLYCDREWSISDTMNVGTGGPKTGYCGAEAAKEQRGKKGGDAEPGKDKKGSKGGDKV